MEAYLEAPPLSTVKDPLAYWSAAQKSGSEDLALTRMALDFLSIPGKQVFFHRFPSNTDKTEHSDIC